MEAERGEGVPNEISGRGTILPKSIVRIPLLFPLYPWLIGVYSWSKQIIEHERNKKKESS